MGNCFRNDPEHVLYVGLHFQHFPEKRTYSEFGIRINTEYHHLRYGKQISACNIRSNSLDAYNLIKCSLSSKVMNTRKPIHAIYNWCHLLHFEKWSIYILLFLQGFSWIDLCLYGPNAFVKKFFKHLKSLKLWADCTVGWNSMKSTHSI